MNDTFAVMDHTIHSTFGQSVLVTLLKVDIKSHPQHPHPKKEVDSTFNEKYINEQQREHDFRDQKHAVFLTAMDARRVNYRAPTELIENGVKL